MLLYVELILFLFIFPKPKISKKSTWPETFDHHCILTQIGCYRKNKECNDEEMMKDNKELQAK